MHNKNTISERYPFYSFESTSLQNNPLNIKPKRSFRIYLPPDYSLSSETRYPVIYFLHGYGGEIDNLVLISKTDINKSFPFLFRLLLPKVFRHYPTFELIDQLIQSKQLSPFILVQPDACMSGIRSKFNLKTTRGTDHFKGSFYVNSPYTGQWADYIYGDVVEYVDTHFPTIPDRAHRAVMGVSMGGYGALYGGIKYPDRFGSVVALSPVINPFNILDHQMIVPFYQTIYGKKKAIRMGAGDLSDLLDTIDLIFSSDARLIADSPDPTNLQIRRDKQEGIENWRRANLIEQTEKITHAFKDVNLFFNCEKLDEYNLAPQAEQLHTLLTQRGFPHQYKIYHNSTAERISPHEIGILSSIMNGIIYCCNHFSK